MYKADCHRFLFFKNESVFLFPVISSNFKYSIICLLWIVIVPAAQAQV